MGRVSRGQATVNRKRVVESASRLFRERGVGSTSVSDVMAEVGLTQGGFYKQFESKDALVAEAVGEAFSTMFDLLDEFDARHPGDHAASRRALADYYLSPAHRDDSARGCPTTGFGSDIGRSRTDSEARHPYQAGVARFAGWMGSGGGAPSDEDIALVCEMVGALMLSRATAGSPLSDRILSAARTKVGDFER
ncbi:TetR/AcrR family transcriptional regulator [Jatrophihabitans sp. DSM 45814]